MTISTVQRPTRFELVPDMAAIGEDMTQPWVEPADRSEDGYGAVAALDVGGMDLQSDQMSLPYRRLRCVAFVGKRELCLACHCLGKQIPDNRHQAE